MDHPPKPPRTSSLPNELINRSNKSTPETNLLASYTQSLNLSSNSSSNSTSNYQVKSHPYAFNLNNDCYQNDTISASDGLASIDTTQTDYIYNSDLLGIPNDHQHHTIFTPLQPHPYQLSRPPSLTSLSASDRTSISSSTKRFEPPSPSYNDQYFEPPPKFSRLTEFNKVNNESLNVNLKPNYHRNYIHQPSPLTYSSLPTPSHPIPQKASQILGLQPTQFNQQRQSQQPQHANIPYYQPVIPQNYNTPTISEYYNPSFISLPNHVSNSVSANARKARSASLSQAPNSSSRNYNWSIHQPQFQMTNLPSQPQPAVPPPARVSSLDNTQYVSDEIEPTLIGTATPVSTTPVADIPPPTFGPHLMAGMHDFSTLSHSISTGYSTTPDTTPTMSNITPIKPMPIRKRAQTLGTPAQPLPPFLRQTKPSNPALLEIDNRPRSRSRSSTMSNGEDFGTVVPFGPDMKAKLDAIFLEFLNDVCSDLSATDSRGEPIHQTLMAKKMQKLDECDNFRPFKFRIQAFTSAFHDRLLQHDIVESIMPAKRVKLYLWTSPYISRFNEDGKKAKSKGNHIWNISARKDREKGGWIFEEFKRKIVGTPPTIAYIGLQWSWSPRIWDPQSSVAHLKPTFTSPALPHWLHWVYHQSIDGESGSYTLTGIPDASARTTEIVVEARYIQNGQEHKLHTSFILNISSSTPNLNNVNNNNNSHNYSHLPTLPTINSSPIDSVGIYSPSPNDEMY